MGELTRKDELEALGLLDRATEIAADRDPLGWVDPDWGEQAALDDRFGRGDRNTPSGDEQLEIGVKLTEYALRLEALGRGAEAYAFLEAVNRLPRGPKDDPEFLEDFLRFAIALNRPRDAARYRRALERVDPTRASAVAVEAAVAPAAPILAIRYAHAKFGTGTLVGREPGGLRIRFEDGERVIVEARLKRVE